jgi:hypothetical protein
MTYICKTLKRILCILFCFIYFASSAGVNINIHYCGGKIKNFSLSHTDEKDCCGTKMKKKDGCCKEKSVVYKVKETQNNSSKTISFNNNASFLFASFIEYKSIKINAYLISVSSFKEPPDIVYNDTYLVNRVFLI